MIITSFERCVHQKSLRSNMCATIYLLFSIVICSLVRSGETLECYKCSHCETPFNSALNAKTEECGGLCFKGIAAKNGIEVRGCLPSLPVQNGEIKNGCIDGSLEGVKGTVCVCDQNLCNAGTRQSSVNLPLAVILGVILIVMTKMGVY